MRLLSFVAATRFVLLTGASSVQAQRTAAPTWPAITAEMRPWTRWWWQGSAVNTADLTANLAEYRRVGLGGVEVTPIYGVRGAEAEHIPYLSPKWVEMLEHTLVEARRLGLGVDIANGTGWPFGGPNVGDDDAAKYVARKTYSLRGGERLADTIALTQTPLVRAVTGTVPLASLRDPIATTPNLGALAIDQVRFPKRLPLQALVAYSRAGTTIDLMSRVRPSGVLDWTAPPGEWTLYAVFQGWHGKQVERAAPGGEGNVIDHFAAQPAARYLSRFDQAFAGRNVSGIRGFFNDSYEVDDASGQGDWTPRLFDEFRTRRGYDLRTELPALFGSGNTDTSQRVLSDYRQTVSDLLLDGFTRTWGDWVHRRRGVTRNQAHGSPSNILDLYAASDIPEAEGIEPTRIKFATSAAHVTGKRLASAEAATWLGEHFLTSLNDVRRTLDNYFLGGVNHVVYHGTAYSPASETWPGRLFYAAVEFNPQNPWWRDFSALNTYASRVQSFLQSGRPDNDVLLYFPIFDRFAERARPNLLLDHFDAIPPSDSSAFRAAAERMLASGFAYDYVSDLQLKTVRARDARIWAGESRYRTVLVPESRFMPVETFQQLVSLARQGATVAFYRGLPADVPGLANLEQRRARLRTATRVLSFSRIDGGAGVKRARVGQGTLLVGDDLVTLLNAAGVRRETATDLHLNVIRRREVDGTTYFIVNEGTQSVDGWVPLSVAARSAAIYSPMDGASGVGRIRAASAGIEAYLQIPAGASCIVRTFDHVESGAAWQYVEPAGAPLPISGNWTLSFLSGGPTLPAEVRNAPLGSWTELQGDAVKNFSGTARYAIEFVRPTTAPAAVWRLDLGGVHESARVTLNDKEIGTLIGPSFYIDIPADALQEVNTLEIAVSNLMANRIADLDRRGVSWRKFYNVNFPARIGTNRGADGLFSAAKWTPLPSGLAGPVTLTPMRRKLPDVPTP